MSKSKDLSNLGGGFTQAGTGAVQRTVESKLQDVVSSQDFTTITQAVTASYGKVLVDGAKIKCVTPVGGRFSFTQVLL
jgi:hypothetical protein